MDKLLHPGRRSEAQIQHLTRVTVHSYYRKENKKNNKAPKAVPSTCMLKDHRSIHGSFYCIQIQILPCHAPKRVVTQYSRT
jgi:hypothetical protein